MVKKAIILVGGKGERFRPLTLATPKPLLPLHGKMILEHILNTLRNQGVKDITLTICYKAEQFRKKIGSGEKFGVNVSYVEEQGPMGTAGFLNLHPIRETTIVINGDDIFFFDLHEFLKKHRKGTTKGGIATLALTQVQDPSSFGTVKLDSSGERILEFVEKGKAASNSVSVGNYIMEPDIMRYVPKKQFVMFEKDIFPQLAREGKLFAYPSKAKWIYARDLADYNMWNSRKSLL